jgi:hypothetical protein
VDPSFNVPQFKVFCHVTFGLTELKSVILTGFEVVMTFMKCMDFCVVTLCSSEETNVSKEHVASIFRVKE